MLSTARFLPRAAGLLGALVILAVSLAPTPAHAVTVSLNTSRTSALPSTPVTFSGSATGAPAGVPVTLQRRMGSGSWSTVKTGGKVSASATYSLSTYVAVGTYSYRAKVGSSAYSPSKTVSGNYGRNVAVPAAGAPFTFVARLPQVTPRVVKFQFSADGSTGWTTRGQATSNSEGGVGIRTYLVATSYVRIVAPATSTMPTWAGPRGRVTIGTDPVIKKILDDTNLYRKNHGNLPPLKLHASLNKIAGNWAYAMHQNCSTSHNPNYSSQYPAGWRSAAENIAWGYSYTQVVPEWIASPSHEKNIVGNYTHIGIGYYFGSKCFKNYYVQDFARF